jgi:hypothetical protein
MDAGFRRHDEGLPLESLNLGRRNRLGKIYIKTQSLLPQKIKKFLRKMGAEVTLNEHH